MRDFEKPLSLLGDVIRTVIKKNDEGERLKQKSKLESIYSLLNAIGRLIFASILWCVCCLPVVTIGPACAALYYSVVKTIRRDRSTISASFFHAFRVNFRQGLWLNLILLSCGGLIVLIALPHMSSWTVQRAPDNTLYLCGGLSLLFAWIPPIIYPALSRFQFTIGQLFRFSLAVGARHFFGTLLLTLLFAAFAAFALFQPVFLILLPGLYAWSSSFLLEPVFKMYSAHEDSAEYEVWYRSNHAS